MNENTEFDHLWNYSEPAGTEAKFRAIDATKLSRSQQLQLQTQIARALGLQRKFEAAYAVLDRVKTELDSADDPIARVRYLLEHGRVLNSSGESRKAQPVFVKAALLARIHSLDFYAIDAVHMTAITEKNPEQQLRYNQVAIELAEKSTNERARNWLGSLYNNVGWTYFEQKRFDDALDVFKKALVFRETSGKHDLINIAHYCIAKTLRAMGRIDEALTMLEPLDRGGYICEELGECHLARGETELARSHFKQAFELLSKDEWLKANEPARLERIRQLGEAR